ncbi:hypothetical protein BJY04DRAFT_164627 [Aspergillus karnatakaensis]|uniref:DUF4267 domain-containing protein n=1 Tax=Aspergillus karnatakaensis TaxID=1810916 RepID=UPI003CCD462F
MPALSQSTALAVVATAFATIPIGFGINAFVNPASALSFFEFELPSNENDRKMVESLMVVYGARDIFIGLATYAAALVGSRKAVGWNLILVGALAGVDGYVCWTHGKGEWTHWSYAPVVTAIGALLLGVFDRP